ncbi:MAG: type III PLP-dependent enzyme [Alphaproteobacteria bacterium]|nr:type III PLP-dependent enzyme [Alphaproteobacteria bacterium]
MNAPVRPAAMPHFATIAKAIETLKPTEPLYLLFPDRFRTAAKRFLDGFPGDALYAVKANPSIQALDQIWAAGVRHFDTASLGEIELVKNRFADAICHFMTPVRMPGAARVAFGKYGVTDYVVDCDASLDKLLAEVPEAKKLRIFVRVATPLGGAILELSSKFGTTPAEAARLLKRVAKTGAAPALTMHVGSQSLSPFTYAQAIEMARRTANMAKVPLAALDVGGGFPGPYLGNDVPPYHWYFDTIRESVAQMDNPDIPLLCEPGRALCAEGMGLVTLVVLAKGASLYMNDGTYGSFDELTLPGWTGDYPVSAWRLDAKGVAQKLEGTPKPFRVFGPTCDTLDVLPRPVVLPQQTGDGDFLLWEAMGAYSVAVRTTFNGFYPDSWAVIGD